ncbi:unnamed protein product [Brassicogethes aeneus]|uniref:Uncharacterized protein n=1 Tax=Brassicogethes aeneus TaxID=1431903 RepID=A0A9P0FQK0_BRAAE|nr:unnamed protein product [Brassicogethes aeneus]
MNDEIITISSDTTPGKREFIQCCYDDKASIVTVNSDSTYVGRVPVSWPESITNEKTFQTPTGVQKVKKWINDTAVNLAMSEELKSDKGDMLSRSDFSNGKSPSVGSTKSNKSVKQSDNLRLLRPRSIESSKKTPKKSLKRLLLKPIAKEEFNNLRSEEVIEIRSDTSSEVYHVPLSPESQKKELYHYLKLMNPADKKEILLIQNRRSTRVKNLNLMQEKKELDKKMRENEREIMNGCLNGHGSDPEPTMKSFKELNIKIEGFKDSSSESSDDDDSEDDLGPFNFPPIVKSKVKTVVNFDAPIKRFLHNIKRSYGKRLEGLRSKLEGLLKIRKNMRKIKNGNKENKYLRKNNKVKNGRIDKVRLKIANKKKLNQHLEKTKIAKNYPKKKGCIPQRTKILRSTGELKNVTIKKLLNSQKKLKKKRKSQTKRDATPPNKLTDKAAPSTFIDCICEITPQEGENVDLENFIDDMVDFSRLSDEHKRCLMESRLLWNKSRATVLGSPVSSSSGKSGSPASPFLGYNRSEVMEGGKTDNIIQQFNYQNFEDFEEKLNKTLEMISEGSNEKTLEITENEGLEITENGVEMNNEDSKNDLEEEKLNAVNGFTEKDEHCFKPLLADHDYTNLESSSSGSENEDDVVVARTQPEAVSPPKTTASTYAPFRQAKEPLSLHRSLTAVAEKKPSDGFECGCAAEQSWETFSQQKSKSDDSHSVFVSKAHGAVLKAFYLDDHLIVAQEFRVSLWTQSALGNVLAAQNMWIPKGSAPRMVLNNRSTLKDSSEMVFCREATVAYVELWIKEHKSEIRQGPVADVFATVYFWKKRQNGLEKKVLQIENINGFADDVQYVVLKNAATIIVSWHSVSENNKITLVHKYCLASDFATVANTEMQSVNHYVSSLHNIEDCESMIIGCGENKITLWNIEHGYIVSTIEMNDIRVPLSTLWVKCDQGFLFTIQQCVNRELRLIAINGFNNTWKKLQSYVPPEGYDRLKGVVLDEGFIISFYDSGILCWKAQTAEPIQEDNAIRNYIPSGKHIIIIEDDQIIVKNALAYLLES